jgi:hypothetical protein
MRWRRVNLSALALSVPYQCGECWSATRKLTVES